MLLLDEPLSALDAKVRISLREEIRTIQKTLGITTIFVTHDQEEALSMSDRIVVMYNGKAEQVGTPFEIYNRPATRFVANFVGTLNVLEGTVADPAKGTVRVDAGEVTVKGALNGSKAGEVVSLALRPEAISLGKQPGRDSSLGGQIADVSFLGSVIRVRVGSGQEFCLARHLQQSRLSAACCGRQGGHQLFIERSSGASLTRRGMTFRAGCSCSD